MSDNEARIRAALNVSDELRRDALVRKIRHIRADAVLDKSTIEYWNRTHPNETPIATDFEDAVIAWCDGKGPLPTAPT